MSTRDKDYVRTGNGFLGSLANWSSYIPVFGAAGTVFFGSLDTFIESAQWLLRGKPASALTALTAGGVSIAANTTSSLTFGLLNIGSGIFTGRTIGTHLRKGTEMAVGGGLGLVGMTPTVLRSYTAGIGSVNGGMQQQAPGYWTNRVSQQQGRDPNQQWAEYVRAQQGAQVGMQR